MTIKQAEEAIEEDFVTFEMTKPYLITRWNGKAWWRENQAKKPQTPPKQMEKEDVVFLVRSPGRIWKRERCMFEINEMIENYRTSSFN